MPTSPPARVAVVLAGGVGARMGLERPKQLIRLGGMTILERSIATFDAHPEVERLLVVMTPAHLEEARAIAAPYAKVASVLGGGATRNESTRRALEVVGDDDARVLFHDAVRPLVSTRIITDCYAALETYDAVDVAIPSADTVVVVDHDEVIRSIPARATLRRGQTPQGFRAGLLRLAYERAARDPEFAATDDCGVVLRYCPETPVKVVAGEERNLKVTEPVDVYLAERLLDLDHDRITEAVARDYL